MDLPVRGKRAVSLHSAVMFCPYFKEHLDLLFYVANDSFNCGIKIALDGLCV